MNERGTHIHPVFLELDKCYEIRKQEEIMSFGRLNDIICDKQHVFSQFVRKTMTGVENNRSQNSATCFRLTCGFSECLETFLFIVFNVLRFLCQSV